MSPQAPSEREPRVSQLISAVIRSSIRVSAMVLVAGLVLFLALPGTGFAERLLLGGILLVVIAPLLNVLQVLFDELARKEWIFAAAAVVVVAMLAWALFA